MKYEGYENYETWCVVLWLTNEQATYEFWIKEAERHITEAMHSGETDAAQHIFFRERAMASLADQIKETVHDEAVLSAASLYTDLLTAALDRVEWSEVAQSFMPD